MITDPRESISERLNRAKKANPKQFDELEELDQIPDPHTTTILDEAKTITSTDREAQYGPAEDSFGRIAELWNGYLNIRSAPVSERLTAQDVAKMMILMKLAREDYKHKRDNCVDIAGYARLLSKIEGDED